MQKVPLLVTAFTLSLSFTMPAAITVNADHASQNTKEQPWVRPLAHEKPRIQHIKICMASEDLGVKKGFFANLREFVAGQDRADRIISPHSVVADGAGKVYVADRGAATCTSSILRKRSKNS
jgi:hypothetical protein